MWDMHKSLRTKKVKTFNFSNLIVWKTFEEKNWQDMNQKNDLEIT